MANFFDIANAYRESVQSGGLPGAPRSGSDELERVKGNAALQKRNAEAARRAQQQATLQSQQQADSLANYQAMFATPKAPATQTAPYQGGKSLSDIQRLAQWVAGQQYGWKTNEWDALVDLVQRESGWNPNAQNPTSSAYGLFQFLDSTWGNYGTKTSDPRGQINAGLEYIKQRYGTPSAALAHWLARKPINGKDVGHWY